MRGTVLRLALALIIPGFAAAPVWSWFVDRWTAETGFFGHGPLVGLAAVAWAAFLASRGRVVPGGRAWPSLIPVLLAIPCLLLLLERDVAFVGAVGWWLGTLGLVWAAVGTRGLWAMLGPLGLLLFIIPWPLKLVDDISLPLKSLALDIGLALSPSEARREGAGAFVLLPGGDRLLVGDVCSGLRSLVTLLALGYLAAAATRSRLCGRMMVFVAAVPIAVASNALRIAVLITVAAGSGADAVAEGTFAHDGTGVLVYVAALGLLFSVSALSGKLIRPVTGASVAAAPPRGLVFVTAVVVLVGATAGYGAFRRGASAVAPTQLDLATAIPRVLRPPEGVAGPEIEGRDIALEPATERLLRPDGFLSRIYGERGSYHLCVVYGDSNKARLHAPEICFRGNGFEIVRKQEWNPGTRLKGGPESVQELRLIKGGQERLLWYWYRSGGESTASYANFILRNLVDPTAPQALFWVSIPLGDGGLRRGRDRLDWFLGALSEPLSAVLLRL